MPAVSADSMYPINKDILNDKKNILSNPGEIFDNLLIKAHGSYPVEILWVLLGEPTCTFETLITNFNNISITLKRKVKLVATRENRTLDEWNDDVPFKLKPGHGITTKYLSQYEWWGYYNFKFGPFDFIWTIYIPEANDSITLVFHCFFFYVGTIVFNRYGEKI